MSNTKQSGNSMTEYRQWIVAAEQKSQDDFDKTILSLSAGGLGVSIVFLKDIVGSNSLVWAKTLLWSWGFLVASLLFILLSFFLSHLALRYTISSIDSDNLDFKNPGGRYSVITKWFNGLGASFFIVGLSLLITFAFKNFPNQGAKSAKACPTTSDPKTSDSPKAEDPRIHSSTSSTAPTPKKQ